MTNQPPEVRGACHCGAVTFSVKGPITRATRCTCSICSAIGALWHGTDESGLHILSGESALQLYQFGTKTAKHYFCRHLWRSPVQPSTLEPEALGREPPVRAFCQRRGIAHVRLRRCQLGGRGTCLTVPSQTKCGLTLRRGRQPPACFARLLLRELERQTPEDTVSAALPDLTPETVLRGYFHATDKNRPHILGRVFEPGPEPVVVNHASTIAFPARTVGREAITDVSGFGQR